MVDGGQGGSQKFFAVAVVGGRVDVVDAQFGGAAHDAGGVFLGAFGVAAGDGGTAQADFADFEAGAA